MTAVFPLKRFWVGAGGERWFSIQDAGSGRRYAVSSATALEMHGATTCPELDEALNASPEHTLLTFFPAQYAIETGNPVFDSLFIEDWEMID